MSFNGGKMRHIFKTEKDLSGGDSDNAMVYLPEWFCDEAKEAMNALGKGAEMYRKIDGSCGAILRGSDGRFTIYQRYDDKKGKIKDGDLPLGMINLPLGENTQVYGFETEMHKHRYFFREIPRVDLKKGSKITGNDKISLGLYKIVDREDLKLEKDFYSVELCGPNFNRTPGVSENGIALHEMQKVQIETPTLETPSEWFVWLTEYFTANRDEGIIVSHRGRYWKIHGYKFCPNLPKDYKLPVLL